MRNFLKKMGISLKGRADPWETLISLLSGENMQKMADHILSGCKSRQAYENIFTVADENGLPHRYRLTITLDSLAGLEKKENGSTGTAKTGGKGERGDA